MNTCPPWCQLPNDGHPHEGLRDGLAHSYADEVYVRPTIEPFRMTAREQWMDAIGCASQMVGILLLAVVLWLLAVGVVIVVTA